MKARYFIQLVMLSALWGASFILTRVAAPQLGPNVSAGLRMLLATVVLAAIMRALKHPWPTQHWRELLLIGFLAVAGPHLLYSWSALHLPGGYGALLSVTAVLFGAFTSAFLKEETLTRGKLTGCVLGLLGAALVVKLGPVEPTHTLVISALVCLGAAALSGTATPLLKRATSRMEPLSITAGMHAAAVLMLLPGALHDLPQAHFTLTAVGAVAVLGVATSGLAYWMFMRIIQHVPPMASMTANFMSTGFGVLWSVLLLDEPTSWAMAAGGGLIVLACLLVSNLNPLRALGALGAKLPPTPP
jgi:drug/metabolite transporter (DMT)-like permease